MIGIAASDSKVAIIFNSAIAVKVFNVFCYICCNVFFFFSCVQQCKENHQSSDVAGSQSTVKLQTAAVFTMHITQVQWRSLKEFFRCYADIVVNQPEGRTTCRLVTVKCGRTVWRPLRFLKIYYAVPRSHLSSRKKNTFLWAANNMHITNERKIQIPVTGGWRQTETCETVMK